MGGIGGLLGLNGGASGTGFAAPQMANIIPGTNPGQINTAYQGAQNSLQSQQALLQALQGQNGLGNQSQVYGQLQGVANGTGPNPAQAMLNQATGQNVANQAALMAGQRGAGANIGLMARQAAQQGASTQQQAAGQAATMQAQQSLNALNSAGALANTQAANQIGATGANTQAQQAEQQMLQNALASQNQNTVSSQNSVNAGNAGLANTAMTGQQGIIGGVMHGVGALAGMAGGGMVTPYADGGDVSTGPKSILGKFLSGWATDVGSDKDAPEETPGMATSQGGKALQSGMSSMIQGFGSKGAPSTGGAPMASMGSLGKVGMAMAPYSKGGNVGSALKSGGHVPGDAKVSGNSYSNDTVKALLSPGELVVDRETMNDKGKAGEAARFLAAVISAKKKGGK